jgi:hypothetical protein
LGDIFGVALKKKTCRPLWVHFYVCFYFVPREEKICCAMYFAGKKIEKLLNERK